MLTVLGQLLSAVGLAMTFLPGVMLLRLADGSRAYRNHQRFMPGVALLWCALWLTELQRFQDASQWLLSLVPGIPPSFTMPQSSFFSMLVGNSVFFVGLALVKLLYRIAIHFLCLRFEGLDRMLAASLYVDDVRDSGWFLRDELAGARSVARSVYYASVIVGMVFFALCGRNVSGFEGIFYPCMGVAVAAEVLSLLGGQTSSERYDHVEEDPDLATHLNVYAKVLVSLRHYLGDHLLHSTSGQAKLLPLTANRAYCERLKDSANHNERLAGSYFEALLDAGALGQGSESTYGEFSRHAAESAIHLLNGRSVLFGSPFYRDYLPYVFLPVSANLVRNRHVVFVYGAGGSSEHMRAFVEDGVTLVTNVNGLWTVGELMRDGSPEPDLAIVSAKDLADISLLQSHTGYFAQTGLVVLVDPSGLLSGYQISLELMSDLLGAGCAVTYCAFDRNCDGLVDALSHALRTSLVEVNATELTRGLSVGAFWGSDTSEEQRKLFPNIVHSLGTAPLVGLVGLKAQVPQVAWVGRDTVPLLDQRWILSQYYAELLDFAELPQEQGEIERHIEFYTDPWAVGRRRNRFLMVEDEYCNLFEVYRQYATRGTQQSFVNIVAPNYLMRDYMVDNARIFEHDLKAIPAIAVDHPKSARNAMAAFLSQMLEGSKDLGEDEVRDKLTYLGIASKKPAETLRELLDIYLGDAQNLVQGKVSDYLVVREERRYDERLDVICERRTYSMGERARLMPCVAELLSVPIVTELPEGGRQVFARRPLGLIWQTMLPGQYVTLDGKYYEVLGIEQETGMVVRRASEQYRSGRSYRQMRTYQLMEPATSLSWERTTKKRINGVFCSMRPLDVVVCTQGYLELMSYEDVCHARRVLVSGVPDRHLAHKGTLVLEFVGASLAVQRTIAVLLSELFVTLFPKEHEYLAVLTPWADELPEGLLCRLDGRVGETTDAIYVVEDAPFDLGALTAVERNIERILEICADYLAWLSEAPATNSGAMGEQSTDGTSTDSASVDVADDEGGMSPDDDASDENG